MDRRPANEHRRQAARPAERSGRGRPLRQHIRIAATAESLTWINSGFGASPSALNCVLQAILHVPQQVFHEFRNGPRNFSCARGSSPDYCTIFGISVLAFDGTGVPLHFLNSRVKQCVRAQVPSRMWRLCRNKRVSFPSQIRKWRLHESIQPRHVSSSAP